MWKRIMAALAAVFVCMGLMIRAPVYANTLDAHFDPQTHTYSFTIDGGDFDTVYDVSRSKVYQDTITFRNTTDAVMYVRLVKVEELTNFTSLYKESRQHIYDEAGEDLYNGSLNDVRFEIVLNPGETDKILFDYSLSPEVDRKPDNSTMGQHMKYRLTFVGEYFGKISKDDKDTGIHNICTDENKNTDKNKDQNPSDDNGTTVVFRNPRTGDDGKIFEFMIIIGIAGLGILVVIGLKERHDRKRKSRTESKAGSQKDDAESDADAAGRRSGNST